MIAPQLLSALFYVLTEEATSIKVTNCKPTVTAKQFQGCSCTENSATRNPNTLGVNAQNWLCVGSDCLRFPFLNIRTFRKLRRQDTASLNNLGQASASISHYCDRVAAVCNCIICIRSGVAATGRALTVANTYASLPVNKN